MLKSARIILMLLLTKLTVAQDLTATQKIPANALPGTEFTIETTINKGSTNGFMKFFQEIPAGFTATDVDSKGGSFTFADGGAKIVWISPPADPIFTISYKVTVPGGVSGSHALPGKISYISNNERKAFDLEPKSIVIGTAGTPVKKEVPAITPTPVTTTEPVKTVPVTTEPVKTTPITTTTTTTQPVTTTTPVKTTLPPEKKAPVTPTEPATFNKVPTSALPASAGKTYRVQIGAFAAKPKIDGVPEITKVVLDNGITKYFSGNFTTYEEAVKRKKEMVDKGFEGAFIVLFENGKIANK